jgi:hypothetical protein
MAHGAKVIGSFLSAAILFTGLAWSSGPPAGEGGTPPVNWGTRKDASFDSLQEEFRDPGMIYAPFVFWFWDEPLDPSKMAEMSRVMCSQRFNPGYAHARRSMIKTPDLPDEEWLHDRWFEAFGAALGQAEGHNSYLGYCDEYWWPSFQANGRILMANPELRAQSLRWNIFDVKGGSELQVPASFFAVAAERIDPPAPNGGRKPGSEKGEAVEKVPAEIRSSSLRVIGDGASFGWKAPASAAWRVYVFTIYNHPGADGGKVNYIDERLAPLFIKAALEPYARQFGDRLGRSIPGDFIDNEGDYGWGLAWSGTLDRRYRERYGRDIRLWMPLMVDRDAEGVYARARWEWFDIVSDIYAETFRAVTQWHEQRGMYTTAHFWEEGIQPQVNAVGDHMKMLRALTMPGQDCLGRKPLRVHDFKESESVAEFQNVRATTELMGAGAFEGTPWGTFNPPFLKQAVNAVTAWGMSHIIPHGIFTTRKLTGNPWPPDWYSENPIFPWLHLWTDFARRASFVASMGHAVPDVLLYNPIESAWIQADAGILDAKMWSFPEDHPGGRRANEIDKVYAQAIDDLTAARIEFLIGDRFYVRQMDVREGKLVRGALTFGTFILPAVDIVELATARKILAFAKAGGRVYALGALPTASAERGMNDPEIETVMNELRSQPTFRARTEGIKALASRNEPGLESPVQFASGAFPMLQHRRRIDGRDFFWLVNNSDQWQTCDIGFRGTRGLASIWDCETGEIRTVASVETDSGSRLSLVFKPYEAYWLSIDPRSPAHQARPEHRPETEVLVTAEGAWRVSYDAKIQPVMEFPPTPPAPFSEGLMKPLEDWKVWGLERFSGLMDYNKTVTVETAEGKLLLDLGRVCHAAEVWVNEKNCGERLWGPHIFDISGAVRPGSNRIRVRVANLINNSYGEYQESGLLGPVRILRIREPH